MDQHYMDTPVCDLVLLSWNHLEETQPCLESLFETTDVPSRLFIVDNGSEPHVREFLRTVAPRGAITEVILLQNETNEGFPRGMNRGLQASTAPFICLLNNDLRFSSGWLRELMAVAAAHKHLGVLNPMSHPPARGQSLQSCAERLAPYRGQYVEAGMCVGFCMLIKREVVERVGGLSEEVERIFFEDEDFCMRAHQADYRCGVAKASYVYHAGHQTVKAMPEREALFTRNQRWCHERWGRWVRMAWPRFELPAPGSEELRIWLETLLEWVRRRTLLYVYCPTPQGMTKDGLFRSVDLVPHEDIRWQPVPTAGARWAAAGLMLKRRKKPLDVIASPDASWARVMGSLRWWHGAAVVPAWDEEQLAVQWRARARRVA